MKDVRLLCYEIQSREDSKLKWQECMWETAGACVEGVEWAVGNMLERRSKWQQHQEEGKVKSVL